MNRSRGLLLATAATVIGSACATAPIGVPAHDADEVYDNLMMLSSLPPDPATLVRITLDQCADLPSCAGSCKRSLSAAADDGVDAAQRGVILADCFAELKKEHASSGITAEAWFAGYFVAYLDRVQRSLPPAKQHELAAARVKLHLVP